MLIATISHKLNAIQAHPTPTRPDRKDEYTKASENIDSSPAMSTMDQKLKNRSLKRRISAESSSSACSSDDAEDKTSSSPHKQARINNNNESQSFFYQPTQTRDLQTSFRIRKHVGEGTFGSVFVTLDRVTRQQKIIKRVKTRDDKSVPEYGFPYTALREIKILKQIEHHDNVIKLHEVVTTAGADGLPEHVFMVLEYMEYDLAAMLRLPELTCRLTADHVQSWTRQLLQGCQHLHSKQIVHRDLKPANLLIQKQQGTLKIGDFGLARKLIVDQHYHQSHNDRKHTTSIGTPWYRAPEILIGSCQYDTQVDMWSTGCILYELGCRHFTARLLFQADTGIDLCKQIDKKFAFIKADETWLANEMVTARKDPVVKQDIMLAKLLSKLLQICPKLRLSAEDALKDDFFADPEPILNMNFPRSSGHELDVIKFFRQQPETSTEK